jgi:tRNA pseudouridine55 synthase
MAKRKTRGLYHGYLIIDKPAGMTSHDVVGRVRRVLGERRVGHAGTLDPAAVGVLPIAVGLATRTVEYLSDASKAYVAEITFGVSTDSSDIDGTVTRIGDASHLTQDAVEQAIEGFRGPQKQVPPMHSAIKIGGEKMYDLARRGEMVELPPRPITIHSIRLESWKGPVAEVYLHCSKGTYIRSLARDLGDQLGTGAYMSNLVRVQTGPFSLEDAIRLDQLEDLVATEPWSSIAWHPDASLMDWPAVILGDDEARSWRNGNSLRVPGAEGGVRVYDDAGHWLGVGHAGPGEERVRPVKVVAEL